ncbi:hypothetical protein [Pseudoxanthomonas sangjuensis]|uniref:hypothetical protein n=1 Tax=Pseudoxanthomonas sangjuensis TaxID=1503750 RepID=UPI001390D2B0|nr:hypothetical protein [Pseudoxanthomonas sangjuensis]
MLIGLARSLADKSLPTRIAQRLICLCLVLAAGPAFAMPSGCGLPEITSARELQQFLSLRAVEVIKRAANRDDGLTALIASSASFSLGAGDVGRPLGTGVAGARELARTMNADTYRFFGWDYMDMPADACSRHKAVVEFIDSHAKNVSRMEFVFESGRVVSATGWERSYVSGRL